MPYRKSPIVAVYPGSFDPVTLGHIDIIRRASTLFNELVIGVGTNPDKDPLFTQDERRDLILPHIVDLPNTRAESYDGLTIDFVRHCNGRVLVRGIRDVADLSDELQQANVNLLIGGIETVFMLASDQYVLISSTYIKQVYELGGGNRARIERLVPRNVAEAFSRKLNGRLADRPARRPAKPSRKRRA